MRSAKLNLMVMRTTSQSPILDFYCGRSPDDRGRYLHEVLAWPDDTLEAVHDYIQWLFPLQERSGANPSAPVLDRLTIYGFRASPELQSALRQSFLRMLRFYGLVLEEESAVRVVEEPTVFNERAKVWLTPGNHNHLRITRILKSTRTLGLEEEARAFFAWLASRHKAGQESRNPAISEATFRFWKDGAGQQAQP